MNIPLANMKQQSAPKDIFYIFPDFTGKLISLGTLFPFQHRISHYFCLKAKYFVLHFCDPILDINYITTILSYRQLELAFNPADADRDRYANSQFDVNVEEYCRETLEPSQVMCCDSDQVLVFNFCKNLKFLCC